MINVLVGCTGSVASIKVPQLVEEILNKIQEKGVQVQVRIVATQASLHFFNPKTIPNCDTFTDKDEWTSWKKRGDEVLHIELSKWADILVIAPLDANSLAKIANGLCDNILLCTIRAWDLSKPLFFCPAMNTKMYNHPITDGQIKVLKEWGYVEVTAIEKTLMCGDTGIGAMAEVVDIVGTVLEVLKL